MAMLRFYIQKGTHKGLYRSIARTLKFFQTFALVEVRGHQSGEWTVVDEMWFKTLRISEKYFTNFRLKKKQQNELISVCLVFQVGHCAIGKWRPLAMCPVNESSLILRWHLSSFQCSPLLIGCRNCEDVCDCHRGSSVFADFHGLVHHQQHQTGDCHHLFIYLFKKKGYLLTSFADTVEIWILFWRPICFLTLHCIHANWSHFVVVVLLLLSRVSTQQ